MALSEAALNEPVVVHMGREFAKLRVEQTVGEALAQIRESPPPQRIIYFYVLDEEGRLKGVVPTRRLLLSPLETPIQEIMVKTVITIPEEATVLEACEFFTLHKLLAFPVVNADRRMIGTVDVEMYTEGLDEIEESERSDELFQLIGVHLTEAQQSSSWIAFRSRFPWLLTNIAGGIMAAFLSGIYEAELKQVVALALFIPVVLALAESVSIQSVSLALQVLRGHPPTISSIAVKLRREAMTGLMLGAASSLLVGLVAFLWIWNSRFAICLFAAITGGVACAAVIGVAIPNVLRLLKRDPQVAAGPIALAGADMVTLLVYFNLARILF